MQVKSTFANARENLSDEQLKQVTGGARINSRPEAPVAHLIGHGDLDLHVADAADGYRLPPLRPIGPSAVIETIRFSAPVTVPGLEDSSGNAAPPIDEIEFYSNGEVLAFGQAQQLPLNLGDSDGMGSILSRAFVDMASAQGDQVSVRTNPVPQLPPGFPAPVSSVHQVRYATCRSES
jgi:hypothetical protein